MMAELQFADRSATQTDGTSAVSLLQPFGIRIGTRKPVPIVDSLTQAANVSLSDAEQELLLRAIDPILNELAIVEPLRHRDLLQLFRREPRSERHLERFARFHTHDDDEGRYLLAGDCVFGLNLPGLGQVRLHLGVGDFLRLPAGTEHWFALGDLGRLIAVRLFSGNTEMATTYTDRPIQALSTTP